MSIILFGAGTTGRFVVRDMIAIGTAPVAFSDNDPKKWETKFEGIKILSPEDCKKLYPDAEWICTIMDENQEAEVLAQIESMGVKTSSFWDFIPNRDSEIPQQAFNTIYSNLVDSESFSELFDQQLFRRTKDHTKQRHLTPLSELYFPEFFTHLDDEHFVDCGAADGDTVKEFLMRWKNFRLITCFEPDSKNYDRFHGNNFGPKVELFWKAVSDKSGTMSFTHTGDYSAHLGGGTKKVPVVTLDGFLTLPPPTFIKMDIEGSELEALWGARRILKDHKPVLAICAYHTADHLWEIPLLIHALQPEYKLFLRRYRPGSWEHVWYAVPPERIVK